MEVLFITPPCLVQFWHEVRCSHIPHFLITHNVGSLERQCIKMILLLTTTSTQRSVVWHKTAGSFNHTYYIFTLIINSQIQELRSVLLFNSHTFFVRLNHRFNVCALLCLILYAGDTVPNDAEGNSYLSCYLISYLISFVFRTALTETQLPIQRFPREHLLGIRRSELETDQLPSEVTIHKIIQRAPLTPSPIWLHGAHTAQLTCLCFFFRKAVRWISGYICYTCVLYYFAFKNLP